MGTPVASPIMCAGRSSSCRATRGRTSRISWWTRRSASTDRSSCTGSKEPGAGTPHHATSPYSRPACPALASKCLGCAREGAVDGGAGGAPRVREAARTENRHRCSGLHRGTYLRCKSWGRSREEEGQWRRRDRRPLDVVLVDHATRSRWVRTIARTTGLGEKREGRQELSRRPSVRCSCSRDRGGAGHVVGGGWEKPP